MGLIKLAGDLFVLTAGSILKVKDSKVSNFKAKLAAKKDTKELTVEEANRIDLEKQSYRINKKMKFYSEDGEVVEIPVQIRRFFGQEADGSAKDIIFKGEVKVKSLDDTWAGENIYMYYPEITECDIKKNPNTGEDVYLPKEGGRLGPIIENGIVKNDKEYCYIGPDGKMYYAYYPLCEVTSGLNNFDLDYENVNACGFTYGGRLQVEMEKTQDGDLIMMAEEDFPAFAELWVRMHSDNIENSKYWTRKYIETAIATYKFELDKVDTVSDAELRKLLDVGAQQDVSSKPEKAQNAMGIDWDFMAKYNYPALARLKYGDFSIRPIVPSGIPPMGHLPGHPPRT